MTKKKKLPALLLATVLALSLAACGPAAPAASPTPSATPAPSSQVGEFTPGAYSASAAGRNGDVTVDVAFSADAIDAVTVTAQEETAGIADPALDKLPKAIVESQSLGVDTVSGATVTSQAILDAVADCITQAGGDVDAWRMRPVAVTKAVDEEITTDVVIAGAGVAGLSAGIEALDGGAQVVLLEKMSAAGGSTALSGGKILAADNYLQRAQGVEDSPALFAEYLMKTSLDRADPAFINLVVQSSAATLDWLVAQGAVFADELETPMADMQPKRGVYALEGSAVSLIAPMQAAFESKGGTLLLETPATELLTDDSGAVVGIAATRADGSRLTVHASAVILATGGFTASPELLQEYAPSYRVDRTNAGAGNTGDGLLMAQSVGADTLANDCLIAQLLDLGPTGRFDAVGLYVSASGERFMNENLARPRKARASIEAIGREQAYIIHDESEVNDRMPAAIEAGTAFSAGSVEELAGLIGADTAVLQATLDRYNELCAMGVDEDFGKDAASMKPIDLSGKLYAIKLQINTAGSTGGILIDTSARALDKSGAPIPGLYAAGEVASGSFFAYEYPGSGTAIQCYATFGRIAGQSASARALGK